MSEIERPEFIYDESHAKAIIRNWISNGEMLHLESLSSSFRVSHKPTRKNFFKMIDSFENVYGDLIVNKRDSVTVKSFTSKKPRYVELALFSDRLALPYHKTKLLPISVMLFDTKAYHITDPVCAFYLSEHLLARIVMRSNATGLKDIASWAREYYLFIMEAKFHSTIPDDDFILLNKDSYIPFTYIDGIDKANGLVAKTWIPKSEWTASTSKKLKYYLESMNGIENCNAVLIRKSDFDSNSNI